MEPKEIKIRINSKIFWYLIFILVIIFLGFLAKRTIFVEKYVAVSFSIPNSPTYIGKISYFPKLRLKNPHLIIVDQNGNVNLVPLSQLLLGLPKGYLELNKNQISWIAPLQEESQVVNQLKIQENLTRSLNLPQQNFLPQNNTMTPQNTSQPRQSNNPPKNETFVQEEPQIPQNSEQLPTSPVNSSNY